MRSDASPKEQLCSGGLSFTASGRSPDTSSLLPLLIVAGLNEKSQPAPGEGPRRLVFRGLGVQQGVRRSSGDGAWNAGQ